MLIWICFYCYILSLAWLYSYAGFNGHIKGILFLIILVSLIYFSGFRDGLGQDYDAYVEVIQSGVRNYQGIEPGYTYLSKLVMDNNFTPVLFFLIFSILTLVPLLLVYRQSNNLYLTIIMFISVPIMFFNSFNIVRQYAAAAIMLYAVITPFLQNKIKWLTCTMVAASFHISVLFVMPIFFLIHLKLTKKAVVILLLGFYIVSHIIQNGLIDVNGLVPEIYSHYDLTQEESSGSGFLSLLMIIFMIYVNQSRINSDEIDLQNRLFNMSVICCCIYLMIPAIFFFYRLSIYFVVALPIVAAMPLKKSSDRSIYAFVMSCSLVMLFLYFLISASGNEKILPTDVKAIGAVFRG